MSIIPKNTDKFLWTKHAARKMRYYRLSESRVKRTLKNPKRKEEGIAPATIAVMQPVSPAKKAGEIWVMYQTIESRSTNQESRKKIKVISAWRYPGVSPKGKEIPIPGDILEELKKDKLI